MSCQDFEEVAFSRKHLNKVMSGRLTTPSPPAVPPLKLSTMHKPQPPPAPRAAVSDRSRRKVDAMAGNVRSHDKGANTSDAANPMHSSNATVGTLSGANGVLPPLPALPPATLLPAVPKGRSTRSGSATVR
jgi:hypothetical protein